MYHHHAAEVAPPSRVRRSIGYGRVGLRAFVAGMLFLASACGDSTAPCIDPPIGVQNGAVPRFTLPVCLEANALYVLDSDGSYAWIIGEAGGLLLPRTIQYGRTPEQRLVVTGPRPLVAGREYQVQALRIALNGTTSDLEQVTSTVFVYQP